MPNDIPMFDWAAHGVAMANAHPELQAVADEVTLSNEEDGIAVVLERLFGSRVLVLRHEKTGRPAGRSVSLAAGPRRRLAGTGRPGAGPLSRPRRRCRSSRTSRRRSCTPP